MSSHSLTALLDLAKEPSSDKRRELLRQVTDVFMGHHPHINDNELGLYDHVMGQLMQDMETVVRAEISARMAECETMPPKLLRNMAMDDIAVAGPLLQHSKALSDDDLLHIIENRGQAHLRAVSQRSHINTPVTDAIVKKGDDTTLNVLLKNTTAKLSRHAEQQVIERAKVNQALHEAVIHRKTMPLDLINELYFVVEAKLKQKILAENAAIPPADLERLFKHSRDELMVAYGSYPDNYEAEMEKVRIQIEKGDLTPSRLAAMMRAPDTLPFLCALSQLAELDYLTTLQLVEKREIDAIAIACKAANLDTALFLTYALIMLSGHDNAIGKAKVYAEQYASLPRETALRTIRFWQLRRFEAA